MVAAPAFFDKTYEEALALLVEARNYIAYQETADLQVLDPDSRLLATQETMRVTCRLTQSMAWLLGQRAAQLGEISAEEALADFGVGGQEVCLDDRWNQDERLPPAIRALLGRTLSLYERVGRLDDMLRQAAA
ncbi:MAG: DUF1465 family protein [Inquilinus sp.]|nr:DUF1465 family protein [Inquilinus sp.]